MKAVMPAPLSASEPPSILMTRAEEDCRGWADLLHPFADRLCYHAPFVTKALPPSADMTAQLLREAAAPDSALVLTSPRALAALAQTAPQVVQAWRGQPVFTVGDGTGVAAKALGFAQVDSAAGDGNDLAARLALTAKQRGIRHFWHLSGTEIAVDFAPPLAAVDLRVTRLPVYEAQLAPLPESFAADVTAGRLRDIVFLSARVAAQFGAALKPLAGANRLRLWCLSPRIADAARAGMAPSTAQIIAAPQPHMAALLPLLQAARAD